MWQETGLIPSSLEQFLSKASISFPVSPLSHSQLFIVQYTHYLLQTKFMTARKSGHAGHVEG
jgi:hypothetical protein